LGWISAAEGVRFAYTMHRLETLRQGVIPQETAETIELLESENQTDLV
jgi:hypothetical protein